MVVRVKVNDEVFELSPGEDPEQLKDDLTAAMRDAPSFVMFRTVGGAHTSVLIGSTTPVVLQEQTEYFIDAVPVDVHEWSDQLDADQFDTWGYE